MIVERVDFISVPVTDVERAKRSTARRSACRRSSTPSSGFPEYQLGENVSLYLLDMEKIGGAFRGRTTRAIRAPRRGRRRGRKELEAKGVEFDGDVLDTGVCHMASSRIPTGTSSCCTGGTRRMIDVQRTDFVPCR